MSNKKFKLTVRWDLYVFDKLIQTFTKHRGSYSTFKLFNEYREHFIRIFRQLKIINYKLELYNEFLAFK